MDSKIIIKASPVRERAQIIAAMKIKLLIAISKVLHSLSKPTNKE